MTMQDYVATSQYASQRPVAMALALVAAVVLSPLYATRRPHSKDSRSDHIWNSGFVLPVLLAGLIIAIKTTSSSSSSSSSSSLSSESLQRRSVVPEPDPSWVIRIEGSSWGLATVLVMLLLVLSWQDSFQHFLWK